MPKDTHACVLHIRCEAVGAYPKRCSLWVMLCVLSPLLRFFRCFRRDGKGLHCDHHESGDKEVKQLHLSYMTHKDTLFDTFMSVCQDMCASRTCACIATPPASSLPPSAYRLLCPAHMHMHMPHAHAAHAHAHAHAHARVHAHARCGFRAAPPRHAPRTAFAPHRHHLIPPKPMLLFLSNSHIACARHTHAHTGTRRKTHGKKHVL